MMISGWRWRSVILGGFMALCMTTRGKGNQGGTTSLDPVALGWRVSRSVKIHWNIQIELMSITKLPLVWPWFLCVRDKKKRHKYYCSTTLDYILTNNANDMNYAAGT